jgi:hypothetical protein
LSVLYDVTVAASSHPEGKVTPQPTAFWEDLRDDLGDHVFRDEYVRSSWRIDMIDEFMNAHMDARRAKNTP